VAAGIKGLLKQMPEKLKVEVERHMRELKSAKVEILDYRVVVSTPYKDKEKKDVTHEVYLEYGNLFILLILREEPFDQYEEVYKGHMTWSQMDNFLARSGFFKSRLENGRGS
jgi:hypothetical protein